MREAQKREGLRLSLSPLLSAWGGEPPKLDQPRFFRVQFQAELRQALPEFFQKALCLRASPIAQPVSSAIGLCKDRLPGKAPCFCQSTRYESVPRPSQPDSYVYFLFHFSPNPFTGRLARKADIAAQLVVEAGVSNAFPGHEAACSLSFEGIAWWPEVDNRLSRNGAAVFRREAWTYTAAPRPKAEKRHHCGCCRPLLNRVITPRTGPWSDHRGIVERPEAAVKPAAEPLWWLFFVLPRLSSKWRRRWRTTRAPGPPASTTGATTRSASMKWRGY
jgi:hypothetical protein